MESSRSIVGSLNYGVDIIFIQLKSIFMIQIKTFRQALIVPATLTAANASKQP
ncbi:MAG: hypothetical protein V4625_15225 [Pseudomonadota bacterium]